MLINILCEKCGKQNRKIARFCKYCGTIITQASTDPLERLIGMETVKEEVRTLMETCHSLQQRTLANSSPIRLNMNTLIIGNTGTGKTSLVETLQELFYKNSIITQHSINLVDAVDWSKFCENWEKNIKQAQGGILCIENVQKLLPDGYSDAICELDKLFNEMGKWDNEPIVILTGLPEGFEGFLAANPAIRNRFRYRFQLKDFSEAELTTICSEQLRNKFGLSLHQESVKRLSGFFKYKIKHRDNSFGNGHLAIEKAENIFTVQLNRTVGDVNNIIILPEDIQGDIFEDKTSIQILEELEQFVGLSNIKEEIRHILSFLEIEKMRNGGKTPTLQTHYIFTGNPGTGKTTIARVMADILRSIEVLPTGHLIEADRSHLVGQYQGETSIKTNALIDQAMGGVLFIDEAYNLVGGDNDTYGKEAVNTLLKRLEDDKGKFICIVAGYSKEMHDFIDTNPGLKSRFNRTMEFQDYTPEEMVQIFHNLLTKNKLCLEKGEESYLYHHFERMYIARDKNFGNAREVVKSYEMAKNRQGERIRQSTINSDFNTGMLNILTRADIEGQEMKEKRPLNEVLAELDEFIGMNNIKSAIRELARQVQFNQMRLERGVGKAEIPVLHTVLTGNPGTGKTSIARKLGEIFKAIGALPTAKVIEADRSQLVGKYQGETPLLVNKLCDRALGGILFIDEAYTLAPLTDGGGKDKYGTEAIETLMKRMEDDRGKLAVIVAGYRTEMTTFLRANPGLESRFVHRLNIEDYTVNELVDIYKKLAQKKSYELREEATSRLTKAVQQKIDAKEKNFGNAREMRKLLDETLQALSSRLLTAEYSEIGNETLSLILPEDIPYDEPQKADIEICLSQLNELTGLENVKNAIREMADYLNMERQRSLTLGLKPELLKEHIIFTGNPGTGKTTVARIMAEILHALGLLSRGHLIEADRSALVSGYTGQTAIKTNQLVDSALGGVLFIDEAYTLADKSSGGFGKEAIDTLLKRLEDDRGKFICIVAGYTHEMQQFIACNPGLQSRFNRTIHFNDYRPAELATIFRNLVTKKGLKLTPEANKQLLIHVEELYAKRNQNFGNARDIRKYFEETMIRQGKRLVARMSQPEFDTQMLLWLEPEDMYDSILIENKNQTV